MDEFEIGKWGPYGTGWWTPVTPTETLGGRWEDPNGWLKPSFLEQMTRNTFKHMREIHGGAKCLELLLKNKLFELFYFIQNSSFTSKK